MLADSDSDSTVEHAIEHAIDELHDLSLPHDEAAGAEETAPWKDDQEWANALTHAIAAVGTLVFGGYMAMVAASKETGLAIACGAYVASAFGTFTFSTLSHFIHRQPALNTLRAWDQAMIYTMISGTYTPIVYGFAPDATRTWLLSAIWIAAAAGFLGKVALRHRINSIGAISYLLLGWMPAIPLAGHVPTPLVWSMVIGGVMYTLGIVLLLNDSRLKYLHAGWHLAVMSAALCHYAGILLYIVEPARQTL